MTVAVYKMIFQVKDFTMEVLLIYNLPANFVIMSNCSSN